MGIPFCTENQAIQIAKQYAGEPDQYIKSVAKSGSTLTFTQKDNTQVTYTPGEGKNWTDVELSIADMRTISDGGQVTKSINSYDPTNFKNDYYRALVDNTGDSVGTGIGTGESFTQVLVDIKDFKTVEGQRVAISPDWYSSTFQKNISYLVSDYGFDFHYYRTILLYAGGANVSTESPVLEATPDQCNMVFLQDVSQQYWEKNEEEGGKGSASRESLEQEVYGLAYVLGIDKYSDSTLTRTGILICYQDSQSSYLDGTSTKWANIYAGKSYPVTFDNTTERWMLNSTVTETSGEKAGVEFTDTEKNTWYSTGVTFPTGLKSAEMLYSSSMGLKAQCFGNGAKELINVISWGAWEEDPDQVKYEFIGRPAGYYLDTYTWEDEEGTKHTETDGEYVWYVEMGSDIIMLTIPASDMDTMVIELNSENSGTLSTYTSLYRHTFNLYNNIDGSTSKPIPVQIGSDYWLLNISFCAVNAQAGDTGIDYLFYSDMNYQTPDWLLPVSGNIAKCDANGTVSNVYDAKRIVATYYTDSEQNMYRCLNIQYINPTDMTTGTVQLITGENTNMFTCTDFRSEIASVLC